MDPQVGVSPQLTTNTKTKASLNPFAHMFKGTVNIFKTNILGIIGVSIIQFVVAMALAALMVVMMGSATLNIASSSSPVTGILSLLGFALIAALVSAYFGLAYTRIAMLGARGEKASFGSAFKIALSRLPITVGIYLLLLLAIFGIGILLGILSAAIPILGILLSIVFGLAMIIFALRWSYIMFILVEDEKPANIQAIFSKSTNYWHKSQGALLLYIFTLFVLYIIFFVVVMASISNQISNTTSTSISYSSSYDDSDYAATQEDFEELEKALTGKQSSTTGSEISSQIVPNLISALVSLIIVAGLANLYGEVREIAGDDARPTGAAGPVPPISTMAPVPPAQQPTTIATPGAPTPPSAETTPVEQNQKNPDTNVKVG